MSYKRLVEGENSRRAAWEREREAALDARQEELERHVVELRREVEELKSINGVDVNVNVDVDERATCSVVDDNTRIDDTALSYSPMPSAQSTLKNINGVGIGAGATYSGVDVNTCIDNTALSYSPIYSRTPSAPSTLVSPVPVMADWDVPFKFSFFMQAGKRAEAEFVEGSSSVEPQPQSEPKTQKCSRDPSSEREASSDPRKIQTIQVSVALLNK